MDKLQILYNVLDNARKIEGVKTEIEVKINYNNKVFNRKFNIMINKDKTRDNSSKKSIKIKNSGTAVAMMFIDMVDRVSIKESSLKKIVNLKIKNFDELPNESNDIIMEYMQSSRGIKGKFNYALDMLSNGTNAAELLGIVREFKRLDISLKKIKPKAINLEVMTDEDLNLNYLKFYGEGVDMEHRKPVSIDFKEKFV